MKPKKTHEVNDKAVGPKGFEFVNELPIEREEIVLGKSYTRAHTIRYELEDYEVQAILDGHREIVVTCIGFMPIIAVGLVKCDLEDFKNLYMDNRQKKTT